MTSTNGNKILAAVVTIIVIGAVITAIVLLDPPGVQRQRKMDARRIDDLINIQRAAEVYWTRHKVLPPDLARLGKESGIVVPANDPETGAPYIYEVTGPKSYRLCAVFARDTAEKHAMPSYQIQWAHGAGRHCFDLKIPKDLDEAGSSR
jgi:hypothetical protein